MSKARNIANNGGRGTTANRPASPLLGDTYFDTTIGGLIVYTANGWGVPLTYTAPSAPTGLSVDPVTAIATFTAPSNTGNSPITSYTVTSSPGSITASGASSGITVAGLTSGTTYTFTVTATNAYGTSVASSPSSAVTYNPYVLVGSMDALASVSPSGSSSITFSAIPQTYTNLQLRFTYLNGTAADINMTLNGSGDVYEHYLWGNGSSASSGSQAGTSAGMYLDQGYFNTANVPLVGVADILDYTSNNKNKTVKLVGGFDNNAGTTASRTWLYSGFFSVTSAINTMTITASAGTFAAGTSFSLYGIR